MLTEICTYLRNWFEGEKLYDTFTVTASGEIEGASVSLSEHLQYGQYYRVIGSVFNDGIHCWGQNDLFPETAFSGSVWALNIPAELLKKAKTIKAWREAYESADSPAQSPYQSESFGGYSYSKGTSGAAGWQETFASSLSIWRKI